MKIAIMQPYFFPYAGYFQLMANVDLFVFLDDVQYTKRGWINRNKILNQYFTVPVIKSSQTTKINQIFIQHGWVKDHLKKFIHTYGNKIQENHVFQSYQTYEKYDMLCQLNCNSLIFVSKILNIKVNFDFASNYPSKNTGESRILELCDLFKAKEYYNLPNGVNLYNFDNFESKGIKLNFVDTSQQPRTSIIESLFHGNANNLRF